MELDHHMNTSYIHVYDFILLTKISEKDYFNKEQMLKMVFEEYVPIQIKIIKNQLHRAHKFSKIRLHSKRSYKYELKLTANI